MSKQKEVNAVEFLNTYAYAKAPEKTQMIDNLYDAITRDTSLAADMMDRLCPGGPPGHYWQPIYEEVYNGIRDKMGGAAQNTEEVGKHLKLAARSIKPNNRAMQHVKGELLRSWHSLDIWKACDYKTAQGVAAEMQRSVKIPPKPQDVQPDMTPGEKLAYMLTIEGLWSKICEVFDQFIKFGNSLNDTQLVEFLRELNKGKAQDITTDTIEKDLEMAREGMPKELQEGIKAEQQEKSQSAGRKI